MPRKTNVLQRKLGGVPLLDWSGLDLTGASDMASILNEAFTEAYTAKLPLILPANAKLGINSQVTAKVPFFSGSMSLHANDTQSQCIVRNLGGVTGYGAAGAMLRADFDLTTFYTFSMFGGGVVIDGAGYSCTGFMGTISGSYAQAFTRYRLSNMRVQGCRVAYDLDGWIGLLDNCYGTGSTICLRLKAPNGVTLLGGEFSPVTDNADAWAVDIVPLATIRDEPVQAVTLIGTVIEANGNCNGLRVFESVRGVSLQGVYFEGFQGTGGASSSGAEDRKAVSVGEFRWDHSASETGNDVTTGTRILAATNDPGRAVSGFVWTGGSRSAAVAAAAGPYGGRIVFGNCYAPVMRGVLNASRAIVVSANCLSPDIQPAPAPRPTATLWAAQSGGLTGFSEYQDGWLQDASNAVGRKNLNLYPLPNFDGSNTVTADRLRGVGSITNSVGITTLGMAGGGRAGSDAVRVTVASADFNATPTSSRLTVLHVPNHANLKAQFVNRKVLAGCWIRCVSSADYATGQYPRFGLMWYENGSTQKYAAVNLGYLNGSDVQRYFQLDVWRPVWVLVSVPDTAATVDKIGIYVQPAGRTGAGLSLASDLSVDVCGAFIIPDPANIQAAIYSGLYESHPRAGLVDINAALRLPGTAAPTSNLTYHLVGDRVINTAPIAGGSEGWVCTTAGNPGTWREYGVIAP